MADFGDMLVFVAPVLYCALRKRHINPSKCVTAQMDQAAAVATTPRQVKDVGIHVCKQVAVFVFCLVGRPNKPKSNNFSYFDASA